ncbi:MAG TPA: SMC family ATPase [Acidimicrobiales bacterium]|nr:SMC family ATPase [Acidimicrobiales bacterium]
MRLTRLYLRNYRVYEDPVELELPPGLVGVFGPNGAGKSTLLESIVWSLWGRARTPKDGIRTADVKADCVTEVEFEHEGHLYMVRRTISGQNHTVRAQAHADGAQVAEGVRDVATYIHSVLGMDDVAFRASVFAEQKQLAAFSSHAPAERRKLVMQLLGITPLDGAREQARRDARAAADQLVRLRALLPDRQEIARQLAEATEQAEQAGKAAAATAEAAARARTDLEAADKAHRLLADVGREHEALVREGRAVKEQRNESAGRVQKLTAELADLAGAEGRLAELEPLAAGLPDTELRLQLVEGAVAAGRALAALPVMEAPALPDPVAGDAAREVADEDRARLAEIRGGLAAARAAVQQAEEVSARSAALSGEEACPLCGQDLEDAFERVQEHRAAELAAARERLAALEADQKVVAGQAAASAAAAEQARLRLEEARRAWAEHEKVLERRRTATEAFEQAQGALARAAPAGDPAPDLVAERDRLVAAVRAGRDAISDCGRIRGRLERRPGAQAELRCEQEKVVDLDCRLENLRDKVRSLAFSPDALAAAAKAAEEARVRSDAAAAEAQRAAGAAAAGAATVDERRLRLEDAEAQHARLAEAEEDARHLGRLADLLSSFRNAVVASVGPRLSAQAADLFGELTDHEYDTLKVDPETYEIQIVDKAVAYGMDRFSGSETDLANLALRVAISEHVRFQSGGAVGLLVLDEVFGPLDEDRKARMLLALERLRGRFRQVLVVTHDPSIKEQMPGAVEVVKLAGRRATARLVNA